MQSRSRIFDDLARLAGGAAGTLHGVREEIEAIVRQRVDRLISEFDLVTREEFDAVRDMAAKARGEQERLEKRVEELEKQLASTSGTKTRKSTAKTSSKSSTSKSTAKSRSKRR